MAVIGRVLAQRRESNAVVESETTDLEWFEQLGNTLGLLGDESSTGGRVLSRCEVWNARRGLVDVVRLLFDVRLCRAKCLSQFSVSGITRARGLASNSILLDLPLRGQYGVWT